MSGIICCACLNVSHFSSTACTAAMAKRAQQGSGEERVTAKSRPMMNLIARTPSFVSFDASRNTRTNLHLMQESRIDDYWNIDGSRDLSDPWTGFTQFTLLDEKPPDGYIYMWSGERLTRKQLTSRPDHPWPELWKSMGKNAKLKEKQKMVWWKAPPRKRTKIAWNLFHRPRGYGIQRNHQERT